MVKGISELRARFQAVPRKVRDEVTAEIEKQARQLVSQMRQLNRYGDIRVNWTWGDAPAGALVVGRAFGRDYGRVAATIYAIGPRLADSRVPITLAEVVEFGSKPRRQRSTGRRTGSMPATPYFFPVYRANRSRARGAITRAITRAVKRA